ncbi:DUF2071 domain-containing protein [Streptomyces sp. NPDC006530]|uniref:DUF2071 domain-containing protein n=1 Tax=Streptomyces sp. NPDC006530 TaxID=3364750 RepID=UPI0036BD4749
MMQPQLSSTIERRLLVNYRVDPVVVARLLPARMRPRLIRGHALAGICMLRLSKVRPNWAPKGVGLRSENAAHRFAVEWDGPNGIETGVYIPRRDTASRVNAVAGGRLFPGDYRLADFRVHETPDELHIAFDARDGAAHLEVTVALADELSSSELFTDLDAASTFFQGEAGGFSTTRPGGHLDGMALHADTWCMEACRVRSATSSFFDDPNLFPPGTATLDSALVMRDLPARWEPLPSMALAAH